MNDFLGGIDLEDEPELATQVPTPAFGYPPTLPHEMAKAQSDDEMEMLRVKYGFTEVQFRTICQRHDFKREYSGWKQLLITEGTSFRLKARALAEEHLPEMHRLIESDLTPAATKLSIFQYLTKIAELEPDKPAASAAQNASQQTKILIKWENDSGTIAVQTGGSND